MITTLIPLLLPGTTGLRLEALEVYQTPAQFTLTVTAIQTEAPCPVCQQPATRIHSHYDRTVADLPWAEHRVCLQVQVRKFFCACPACPRHIFTERLPAVVAPWARRTHRLAAGYASWRSR